MAQHIYGLPEHSIDAAQKIIDDLTIRHRALVDKAEELAAQRRELRHILAVNQQRSD